ncbi:hypothetical protein RVR_8252 [Actinacidiphila reveromycinica]|uniref:Uncharacterized protein n=1 Tax=Actinacidiphila reveromycinica TaxID=659352 RepID=A0A7U3VRP4_9ACTN|nr:hypothetical protein [Streptomyces sp. SN-593]BBB01020.1 hypothetical protein RVR_8252 [Streptomyces sp. SN-593]
MTARDELYELAVWGDDRTANQKIDAYRAEVLYEAIANETIPHDPQPVDVPTGDGGTFTLRLVCGQMPMRCVRWGAPTFFQPGRTYTSAGWQFRCDTVTTHPHTGERVALGWARIGRSEWTTCSETEDTWTAGHWTETTDGGAPTKAMEDAEPDTPARRAARAIQALHDPAVIGYIIGPDSLSLRLHPTTWQQWTDWQKRLDCPIGLTTYRGGSATAHGWWDKVPVTVTAILDRLSTRDGGAS